jgi:putative ABC transport system permease protein
MRKRPAPARSAGADGGGAPARRAVIRWAWRLFRREWRQQLLVLSLITAAVAGTVLGAAVIGGWLFAGRQLSAIARQPLE